jgi:8-oxo-dGTP pyrophosphatase MutT (NUDIX family)
MDKYPIKFEVVAGVIEKNAKVLMCRSKGNEHYYLPGGKLEAGESEQDAIIRECKEELSIELIPETIEKLYRFEADAYGFSEPRIVVMNCYKFEYQGEIRASAEIEDVFWAGLEDLDKLAPAAKVLLKRVLG